jgi:hypothetical protein
MSRADVGLSSAATAEGLRDVSCRHWDGCGQDEVLVKRAAQRPIAAFTRWVMADGQHPMNERAVQWLRFEGTQPSNIAVLLR